MSTQTALSTAILVLTALSAVGGGILTIYAIQQRTDAARAYALLSGFAACWSVAYFAQLAAPSVEAARFTYQWVVLFAVLSPSAWLAFTIVWTNRRGWLTHPLVVLVLVEPLVYLGLFYTEAVPSLVDATIDINSYHGLLVIARHETTFEIIQVFYIYAIIVAGNGLLVHTYLESRHTYRRQTALLLVGSTVVFASNVVWFAGLSPHPDLDLTPVLSVLHVIIAGYAIFGYGALRRLPVTASAIIDALDDPLIVVDPADTVMDCNHAAADMLPDGGIGTDLETALPGLTTCAETGATYSAPTGDSNAIYEVCVTPATTDSGDTIAYTYHLQNVTHRVHREETLSALHVASRRFTTAETREEVAEIARDALVDALSFDYAGVLLHDPETDQLSPTALTDELADAMGGAGPISPGESFLWPLYEAGEPYVGPVPDDSERQYDGVPLAAVAVIPLGDHGLLGAGSVDEDHESLTDDRFLELLAATTQAALDRADREAELRVQREQVAAQHDRIEFFNSLLRHDLLNGLMIVRGHVDLLERSLDPSEPEDSDDSRREHLEVIDRWTADMADLIQRIRSVIDTLSGGDTTLLQPIDIGPILREKTQKLAATHDTTTVTTQFEDVDVRADALVGDVIGNVLFNAVEHHDRDEQHIDVATTVHDDRVVVRIADDGPGVPDDAKDVVFEKDYTTRGNGTLGFGLYFVAVTVDRYGGSVHFEDNHPRGTVVVIELPRASAGTGGANTGVATEVVDSIDSIDEGRPAVVESERPGQDPTDS